MRFDRLDLNLLIVLDALLKDRSVSSAANRINLSQSATSSALARLRAYFDDELLVMRGRAMVPTPRAEELAEPVAAVLQQIRDTIATPRSFDPLESDRKLTIMTSDYGVEVLLAPMLTALAAEAPSMTFHLLRMVDEPVEQLGRGLVDVVVAPDKNVSTEHPSVDLLSDEFVVVGWEGNPALDGEMTKELYGQLGHVAVRFGRAQVPSFEEWVLRHRSITRRMEVVAPDFTSVPPLISGSLRIATMHRRLAEKFARPYELRILEAPFDIPPVKLRAQWLSSARRDPALLWLVERMKSHAALI